VLWPLDFSDNILRLLSLLDASGEPVDIQSAVCMFGGAAHLHDVLIPTFTKIADAMVRVGIQNSSAIFAGGTDAGVMKMIGHSFTKYKDELIYTTPGPDDPEDAEYRTRLKALRLIGVAPFDLVSYPGHQSTHEYAADLAAIIF
jgi:hypothetical protein